MEALAQYLDNTYFGFGQHVFVFGQHVFGQHVFGQHVFGQQLLCSRAPMFLQKYVSPISEQEM